MSEQCMVVEYEGQRRMLLYSSSLQVAKQTILQRFGLDEEGWTPADIGLFVHPSQHEDKMAELDEDTWSLWDRSACRYVIRKSRQSSNRAHGNLMSRRTASMGNLATLMGGPAQSVDIESWRRGQAGHPYIGYPHANGIPPSPPLSDSPGQDGPTSPVDLESFPHRPAEMPPLQNSRTAVVDPGRLPPSAALRANGTKLSRSVQRSHEAQMNDLADSLSSLSSSDSHMRSGQKAAIQAQPGAGTSRQTKPRLASSSSAMPLVRVPITATTKSPTSVISPRPIRKVSSQEFLERFNKPVPASAIPPLPSVGGNSSLPSLPPVPSLERRIFSQNPLPYSAPPSPALPTSNHAHRSSPTGPSHLRRNSLPIQGSQSSIATSQNDDAFSDDSDDDAGSPGPASSAAQEAPAMSSAVRREPVACLTPARPPTELRKLKSTSALSSPSRKADNAASWSAFIASGVASPPPPRPMIIAPTITTMKSDPTTWPQQIVKTSPAPSSPHAMKGLVGLLDSGGHAQLARPDSPMPPAFMGLPPVAPSPVPSVSPQVYPQRLNPSSSLPALGVPSLALGNGKLVQAGSGSPTGRIRTHSMQSNSSDADKESKRLGCSQPNAGQSLGLSNMHAGPSQSAAHSKRRYTDGLRQRQMIYEPLPAH